MSSNFPENFRKINVFIFVAIFFFAFFCFYTANIYNKGSLISLEPKEEETKTGCQIPPFRKIDDFFEYGKKEKYKCKNMKEIGGTFNGDGSKFMCFDKPFEIVSNNCVVLSFGIDNEWSFDDIMAKMGCTVYCFDPTMGEENFDRSPNIHFYNLGLFNYKGEANFGTRYKYKVDRYENILKMLNLTEKKIDYLKMDIESAEFEFFEDVLENSVDLLQNVKQIGMEVHPKKTPKTYTKETLKETSFFLLWKYFHELECLGFQLLHYAPNLFSVNLYHFRNRTESECYELVWVKK